MTGPRGDLAGRGVSFCSVHKVNCFLAFCALAVLCNLMGCARHDSNQVQGYVEGEYVYVASPLSGTLESLYVQRGMNVKEGDPLFALDSTPERAGRDEAERRVLQARASLEDAKKGKRPSEIESLKAQLKQAQAALALSEKDLARQRHLFGGGASTAQALDRAFSTNDQNRNRVSQLEADIMTAQLGSRSDQISAADAALMAQEAVLAKAQWDLSQKSQSAPQSGLVFDTLYRAGEWVPAGRPVVALLPPQNIKIRAFVPEPRIGTIQPGDNIRVLVDGVGEPLTGKVSFISPKAEYTPPVIYSREARSKLVVMIEAVLAPEIAKNLHPGQPVDVQFGL